MFCRRKKKKVKEKRETATVVAWRPIEDEKPIDNGGPAEELAQTALPEERPTTTSSTSVDDNSNVIASSDSESKKSSTAESKKSSTSESKLSSTNTTPAPSNNPTLISVVDAGVVVSKAAVLFRRKALRDDDDDVKVVKQEISAKEAEDIQKALESNSFISAVASDALRVLAGYMQTIIVSKDQVIMRQGEEGDSMYVSKSGEYEVLINNQVVNKFKDCRLFGELAVLHTKPRTATVRAVSDGALWQLKRNAYKTLLRQSNMFEKNALLDFLRKVPIINAASDDKLRRIAGLCDTRSYPRDAAIIREGQRGDEFFIIKSGTAYVSKAGMGKLKSLERGDFFGDKALLGDEDVRKATVTAGANGVECLVLPRADFNKYLGDVHQFLAENDEENNRDDFEMPRVQDLPKQDRFPEYRGLELKELLKGKRKQLGEGGFGIVHLVQTHDKRLFALKEMRIKDVASSKRVEHAYNEKNIQKMCDSVFIVNLYRTFNDDQCMYYLLEYCPRGELFALLRTKKYFNDVIAKFAAACVLEALHYLHRRRIAYLDLKPENILIDRAGYPKLADFGNAIQLDPGKKSYIFVGTPEYMAPETIKHMGTDAAADYWAYGVLIYEMLLGRTPFFSSDEKCMFDNVTKGLTPKHFAPNFNKTAKDLIKKLVEVNPNKRLGRIRGGAQLVREHDWFKDTDFPKLCEKGVRSPLLSLFKK